MSTIYDGKPSNVSFDTPLYITGITYGVGIATITVSGSLPAQFYQSGGLGGLVAQPWVDITGVSGVGAANGVWPATPTGVSTFTIPASIGSGAYTTGGIVQPLYMKPVFSCPSDGDGDTAASVASVEQVLADRTAFLGAQTGVAKIAGHMVYYFSSLSGAPWASTTIGTVVLKYVVPAASDFLDAFNCQLFDRRMFERWSGQRSDQRPGHCK